MAKRRNTRSSRRSARRPSRSEKHVKDLAGTVFVGFFFLGLVSGAIYGRWDLGALAGLGMGFMASSYVKMRY
ncbi:MAG: hypothetical protein ABIE55_03025 [Candidatus Aenigmatarchaeota archaeon]